MRVIGTAFLTVSFVDFRTLLRSASTARARQPGTEAEPRLLFVTAAFKNLSSSSALLPLPSFFPFRLRALSCALLARTSGAFPRFCEKNPFPPKQKRERKKLRVKDKLCMYSSTTIN